MTRSRYSGMTLVVRCTWGYIIWGKWMPTDRQGGKSAADRWVDRGDLYSFISMG